MKTPAAMTPSRKTFLVHVLRFGAILGGEDDDKRVSGALARAGILHVVTSPVHFTPMWRLTGAGVEFVRASNDPILLAALAACAHLPE